jgi:PPM family protein phosphatase
MVGGLIDTESSIYVSVGAGALHATRYGLTCAVADGVGGGRGGGFASRFVLDALAGLLPTLSASDETGLASALCRWLLDVHNRLLREAELNPELSGMATTLTSVHMTPTGVVAMCVGDSRLYRCRAGTITQLSRDETLGALAASVGMSIGRDGTRGPLTNALGMPGRFKPTAETGISFEPGDVLVLCTDGLTDVLPQDAIRETVDAPLTLQERGNRLVDLALRLDAPDNLAVVLVAKGFE